MTPPQPDHPISDAVAGSQGGESLAAWSETARTQAWERFQAIRPFLHDGVPLPSLARHHAISLRTARRWVQQYRQGGLVALCRQPRADQGTRRALAPELIALVEGLALQTPRRSVAAIYRTVAEVAQERRQHVPSYDLVHDIVRQMAPALVTLAQEGRKAYSEAFDLLYRREAEAPNAIWQADHTLLDIVLRGDHGQAQKPWLTVIIDDYSRAIAGYLLSFDAPSALHTALALRQAIWRKAEPTWQVCGIPEVLYTDHGSDFTSKHLEQVCADLKICPVFSQVGQPRGRGRIERFFNTVNQLLLCRLPGYAPAGFATKVTPVLDMQGLHQALEHFVLHEYHQTPHSATGISPQARWHAGGFLPQLPESLEQLDLLLLTVAQPRKVRRDGIWFLGMRYLDPTLAAYVGESVLVRYDPRDVAEVRVFYHDRFLCRAICQELAGATVPLRDIIRARNRHRRTLRQTIEQRAQIVDTLLSLHRGHSREAEHGASHTAEVGELSEAAAATTPRLKRYYNE